MREALPSAAPLHVGSATKGGWGMADKDDQVVALLKEIRDLQQRTVDGQRQALLFVLPIFALMTIAIILALTGFFAH